MDLKCILVLVTISTVALTFALPGDETYVHDGSTLILKSDGTYRVEQETSFGGDYHVYDDKIELEIPFGILVLHRSGADLIDQDADLWVKM